MGLKSDLYGELGVDADASDAEIRAAYLRAAKQHHPDKGGDAAKFDRAARANMVLSDPAKRAEYDRTGKVDDQPDNELSMLSELLCGAFETAIGEAGPKFKYCDLIASTIRLLKERGAMTAQVTARMTAELAQFAELAKRLTGGGEFDPLGRMLAERQAAMAVTIARGQDELAAIEKAIEMAATYKFSFERPVERTYEQDVVLQGGRVFPGGASWVTR